MKIPRYKIQSPNKSKIPSSKHFGSCFLVFGYSAQRRGQGLLEAVVALGIVVTGVIAALTLAVANLTSGTQSELRIAAANLAREGVEVVRNVRDTNWVRGAAWNTDLAPGNYVAMWDRVTGGMQLMATTDAIGAGETHVYRDSISGVWGVLAGSDAIATPLYRGLTLSPICKDGILEPCNQIGIRTLVGVAWERRGEKPTAPMLTLVADLYKWR